MFISMHNISFLRSIESKLEKRPLLFNLSQEVSLPDEELSSVLRQRVMDLESRLCEKDSVIEALQKTDAEEKAQRAECVDSMQVCLCRNTEYYGFQLTMT